MNSFSILRSNVGLTTNVKVMVSSNYNLYLESIDSDAILSSSKFKKFSFNKNTYYDEVLPIFFKDLPVDISYKVKYDDDNDIMYNTFDKQYDDIYQMGCRNIIDNKNYNEEFECFAPIYIGNDKFPNNFIIFRIDGPGLINLNKDNFRDEIVDNLKCVKIFDLTKNTPIGEWINKNFIENSYFPKSPFYMDYRKLEFSSWNGIDYEVGGYVSKSFFLDSVLEYENTYNDMEKLLYDGYKNNKVVFPNILNLSFLFDDTPATPNELRKWSINRYMGFYVDEMEVIDTFNPYQLPLLKEGSSIIGGNILINESSDSPFVDNWENIKFPFIEVDGVFYKVEKYTRTYQPEFSKTKLSTSVFSDEFVPITKDFYKVISDINLQGSTNSSINSNTVMIDSDESGYFIYLLNNQDLIPDYSSADVWVLNINNLYHVIKKVNNKYYLHSDYGFRITSDKLEYWINSIDDSYKTTIKISPNSDLISFKLFRCKFTDIKDFDTSIVDTDYSKFEYEKQLFLTNTDETKIYTTNYSSINNPKDYNDYMIDGRVSNIPCSSEYTANGETFRIVDGDLSDIWRKNSVRVKWGYQNSISSNDYPYLLNNSFLSEDFNRTTNIFNPLPNRRDRNLDYFYSVNSSTSSYTYHSLHVENILESGDIDNNFSFDLNEYISNEYDYFYSFFGRKSKLGENILNVEKWSIFEVGDSVIPNSTLFRGLKMDIHDVRDIKLIDNVIENINLQSNNTFQGYKFSILLSKNNYKVVGSESNLSIGVLLPTSNQLNWKIIDNWTHDKNYNQYDIVSYYDILYMSLTQSIISDPNENPSNSGFWSSTYSIIQATYSVFWNPNKTYVNGDFVYNSGEYYYYEQNNGYTFWNPGKTYDVNEVVIYDNKTWISTTQSNIYQPASSKLKSDFLTSNFAYYWNQGVYYTDWNLVEIWSPTYVYSTQSIIKNNGVVVNTTYTYCVQDGILYKLIGDTNSNENPSNSINWERIYSMIPDTNYVYKSDDNPIILLNNKYYYCLSNMNFDTLENGICVYINKKYKNILINIYINDNTLQNINNADRDLLYNDIYSNITAANFANAINDISNKFGFSDYLQYVIINDDNSLNSYSYNNLSALPYIITYQNIDRFYSRISSINYTTSTLEVSQFKPRKTLDNGKIVTIDDINNYNGNSLGINIDRKKDDPILIDNYHGLKNNIYNTLYRYSGNYCPIFYKIQIFESGTYSGNYVFDTSLTNFGIMKERVISKINRKDNILKLKFKPDVKSIYPMIDEFGYTFVDYFIFKSTWDDEYYIECLDIDQNLNIVSTNKILKSE